MKIFLDMDGVIVDFPQGSSAKWGEPGFWESLPKCEWADKLVANCMSHFEGNVHILSSHGGGPASVMGKMQWLQKHYPYLVHGAIFAREKYHCAGPRTLLIDDDPENVTDFIAAGGQALLFQNEGRFPNESLALTYEETVQCLKELW